ncbi:class I SAM-dependent methyltransferase [Streptomyces brasiliensis]|uniref:Methyltransferase domain-containing protein n=1 Tax=Streptomyces brasiliensis TaxID=1954 RepID=A0A917KW62_9ACTN|nr:methyltransferase domain-containing protein [Streptomyces brasiliensis]GGJ30523.1 hypothetical protein GCM10010121_047280 [Streptomyces brasiliensis]
MSDAPDPVRDCYDRPAPDHHLIFPDSGTSMARQAAARDGLLRARLGAGPCRMLDCACGIGTQAVGLALTGHHVTGTDLSPDAVSRAAAEAEAAARAAAVADMRALPFRPAAFDAVVCTDNSLPHLLPTRTWRPPCAACGASCATTGCCSSPSGTTTCPAANARRRHRPRFPGQGRPRGHLSAVAPARRRLALRPRALPARARRYGLGGPRPPYRLPGSDPGRVEARGDAAGFTDVTWHEPPDSGSCLPLFTARTRPARARSAPA